MPRVRLVHDTNPRKYFGAVLELARCGEIELVGAHRHSVVKGWLRAGIRERKPLATRTADSLSDLWFRCCVPFVRGETVILGFAPWDWRLLIYGRLSRRNRVIYHTSWPYWDRLTVPHKYGPFSRPLRRLWLNWLTRGPVEVVCILDATKHELQRRFGIEATVIGHAVDSAFAGTRAERGPESQLKLLFVGALSRKKGVLEAIELANSLRPVGASLTIVGDGDLRSLCVEAATQNDAIRYVGPIHERAEMAEVMASHDILIVLSRSTPDWEELFGMVIVEAISAGLGVVATDHIGPRAILGSACLGNLFKDGDIEGPRTLLARLAVDGAALDEFKMRHANLSEPYEKQQIVDKWRRILVPPNDAMRM